VGKKMSADAVGETYLWLHQQKPCLWTHELDMRPACEKFYRCYQSPCFCDPRTL
jgi:hypothetical protein